MKQIELNELEVYSKLLQIEKHLGYSTMSFYTPTYLIYQGDNNIINIQKEASQMLRHVGLFHHMPLITFTKTGQSIGGNVQLDNSDNVFIEIDEKYRNSPSQSLAIMAHEICHKVLYTHGLYYHDKIMNMENEVLTDLATIYVGFGKLSLNGCYRTYQTKDGNVTTTHTETIGYVTKKTFAIAYNIVCARFSVTEDEKQKGLYDNNYLHLFTRPFLFEKTTTKDLQETIKNAQASEATTYKYLIVLEGIISQLKKKIIEKHELIYNDLVVPFDNEEVLSKQQLLAMLAVSKHQDADILMQKINTLFSQLVKDIRDNMWINIDFDIITENLKNIECPICGFKKENALKENKTALFKCPKCNRLFLWDGELQDNEEEPKIGDSQNSQKKKSSFFSRLFKK